jgi:hypothetical protein
MKKGRIGQEVENQSFALKSSDDFFQFDKKYFAGAFFYENGKYICGFFQRVKVPNHSVLIL